MFQKTLQDAMNYGPFAAIAGVPTSSPQFADLLNEATRRLLRRGDWFDTDFQLNLCVSGTIIAWPRCVGAIRGVRFAGNHHHRAASLFNNWFSFIRPEIGSWGGRHGWAVIEDMNRAPTANDITGTTGKNLRYYTALAADNGKTITFFGNQYGAQPLQEQQVVGSQSGQTVNGMTLTAAAPYATNGVLVTNIDAITRQATQGPAYLYEYDPVANTLRDLAFFEPGDTNPRFRRSRIVSKSATCSAPDANGICWTSIEALVKVEFVPVVNPRDFLMIDNFDALKFMIQAINCEEADDEQTAEVKITKAIRELNFELRNKNLDGQTSVSVNAIMGRGLVSPM